VRPAHWAFRLIPLAMASSMLWSAAILATSGEPRDGVAAGVAMLFGIPVTAVAREDLWAFARGYWRRDPDALALNKFPAFALTAVIAFTLVMNGSTVSPPYGQAAGGLVAILAACGGISFVIVELGTKKIEGGLFKAFLDGAKLMLRGLRP